MPTRTKVLLGILVVVIGVTGWVHYQANKPNCVTITPEGDVVRSCNAEGETITITE